MARSSSMTYNPTTGIWEKSSGGSSSTSKNPSNKNQKDSKSSNTNKTSTSNSSSKSGKLTSTNTDKKTSTGKTEKKYNTIEYNILEGTLKIIATKSTIKIKAGDTIKLKGFGKYLSGKYYVQDVTRNLTSSGYEMSLTVIKTDYGDSIKSSSKSTSKSSNSNKSNNLSSKKDRDSSKKTTKTNTKVHYLKKGESLWTIAVKYYKDGSKYEKIAKANNLSKSQYMNLPIGKKLIIP